MSPVFARDAQDRIDMLESFVCELAKKAGIKRTDIWVDKRTGGAYSLCGFGFREPSPTDDQGDMPPKKFHFL